MGWVVLGLDEVGDIRVGWGGIRVGWGGIRVRWDGPVAQ